MYNTYYSDPGMAIMHLQRNNAVLASNPSLVQVGRVV
jgi:hypothetical protein